MLFGNLIVLRHVEQGDLDALIRNLNDARAREYVQTVTQSPQKLRAEFAANGMCSEQSETLLIEAKNGATVGATWSFKPYSHFSGREIAYHVFSPEARRKGYASEAAELLTTHLFSSTPINRLQARVNPANLASARIVAKLAFKLEGRMRQSVFIDGRDVDHDLYGLLRSEWVERRLA